MFSILKKNQKPTLNVGVPPEVRKEDIQNYVDNLIYPCMKDLPKWWKTQPAYIFDKVDNPFDYIDTQNHSYYLNTTFCPSFVNLFKNSFLIKSPCDFYFENDPERGYRILISNRSLLKHTCHDVISQMNNFGNGDIHNIKLEFAASIFTNIKSLKFIFFSPYYYNPNFPLTVMPGILPLGKNIGTPLNLNLSYNKKDKIKFACKAGDVLALLYSTEKNLPKIIPTDQIDFKYHSRKFGGSWFYLNKDNNDK